MKRVSGEGLAMFEMSYAAPTDAALWLKFDAHIQEAELLRKIHSRQCYLLKNDNVPVGLLRYGLFWDSIPFVNLLFLVESARGKGYGRSAMRLWEMEMRAQGHASVMTSTQADESAQHFYRKLGYKDCGCLILDQPPLQQPAEIFFIKTL